MRKHLLTPWLGGLGAAALLFSGCTAPGTDEKSPETAGDGARNMIGRQTQNEGIFAVPAKGAVKVDGELGEWDLSGQIWSFADTAVRDRFSVKTAAMWDPDNLYLSFYWKDPMPLNSAIDPDFDPTRGWVADAIQLRIRTAETIAWVTAWCQGEDRPNFDIAYWNDLRGDKVAGVTSVLMKGKKGSTVLEQGVESAYKKLPDGDGFIQELKIPWKVLLRKDVKMKAGDKIQMGVEFMWGDPTGRTWPIHRYADNLQPGKTSREFFWSAKDAWGDLALVAGPVAVRDYVAGGAKLQGTIPVRATIPADATYFSLVIEDQDGNRVRNLAGEFPAADYTVSEKDGKRLVEVMWDGLTDSKKLAKPGTYRVRGVTQNGLGAEYEMCFYNPGTPPWDTADGRGGWGADHSLPEALARSGKNMVVACGFVEGGYGIWALGPDGRKIWSEKRGMTALAANDKYVYSIPNAWDTKEQELIRLKAATGKYAPFVRDGKELPFSYPFRLILNEEKPAEVLALAAGSRNLIAAQADRLLLINGENATKLKEFPARVDSLTLPPREGKIKKFTPLAFDDRYVYYFSSGKLTKLDTTNGASTVVALDPVVEIPAGLALDAQGNLAIADRGADQQIKLYNPQGKLLKRFGVKGGRASQGVFNPEGMRDMSSVAVGADGRIWTTEYSYFPRRVSVWKPDGKLDRDYIGNTGYAGTGTLLHDNNSKFAYEGANEMVLDHQQRTWKMAGVALNPPADQQSVYRMGAEHAQGHVFTSKASGRERDYYFLPPYRDWAGFLILMKEKDAWRPVSAITTIGRLAGELDRSGAVLQVNKGDWSRFNEFDCVIWNDLNRDSVVQLEECEIYPAKKKTTAKQRGELPLPMLAGWGQRMDPEDLSFYAGDRDQTAWKYTPVGFGPDGAPRYSGKTLEKVADLSINEAVPVPGENTVVAFANQNRQVNVVGMDKNTGEIQWSYPSPYHQVHGSHRATMPKPGLLIGPLKVVGVIPGCGEAGNVFMMRGNLGQDFYMTTDGIYIGTMFQDGRLPGMSLPNSEEQLRGMPMELFSMGAEPFNGWIGRQDDGVVRMTCGLARQASMILQVKGLENIRRFNAPSITVTNEELIAADRANAERNIAAAKAEPYTIARVAKLPDGRGWNALKAMRLETEGQPVTGECRLAYNDQALFARFVVRDPSPWKNGGEDFTRLFKTGDAVDIQLSPNANAKRQAVADDLRVVIAPFQGKPVAVLMKKVAPNAKEQARRYQSPVGVVEFDQVCQLPEAKIKVGKNSGSYTVEAEIPWSSLGIKVTPGMKMRGDAGFILSDEAGTINTARIYYSNPDTNLVSDMPLEAELNPDRWTEFKLAE